MGDLGFFERINNTFGSHTVKLMKDWMKTNKMIANYKNRRVFLLQCRTKNIMPNHIVNNIDCLYSLQIDDHPFKKETDKILKKLRRSVLNLEIKVTLWKLTNLETERNNIEHRAEALIPRTIFLEFKAKINRQYKVMFSKIRTNNIKKIISLQNKSGDINLNTNENFITNYTNVELPDEAKRILNVGPKFGIPITKKEFPIPKIIKEVEYCISLHNITQEKKELLRCKAVNIITNFYSNINTLDKYNPILKDFDKTKKFIKENPDILVSKSDKGNSTVIIYKQEYIDYMKNMFADQQLYKILKSDPTTKFQNKANKLIKELENKNILTSFESKNMIKHNRTSPKAYGLRKTHKQTIAYRPVISNVNAPSYELSVFVHVLLSKITSTFTYTIKNSYEMVHFLENVNIPDDYILISLDVVSLFPSIPKQLVISIIQKKWKFIECYTDLKMKDLIELVEFIFDSSYFSFDNTFYQQLDGTAMGNPASPSLAALVMNFVINEIIDGLDYKLPFFKLYVDDSITAVPKRKVQTILNIFNSYNSRIQFTLEIEQNSKIPFLDLLLIRSESGQIRTSWYNKPTSSGRTLNYLSNHPTYQKNNNAKNLLERCISLTSVEFLDENLEKVKTILKNNNYPKSYINIMLKKVMDKQRKRKAEKKPNENADNKLFCKFPYIDKLSQQLQQVLSQENCKMVFYNLKLVNNLFSKIKDQESMLNRSNLIYKINCLDCIEGGAYVGQTRQLLAKRIKQHQYDCSIININKENKTALSTHHFDRGHNFDFQNCKILDVESNWFKRNIAEMIFIEVNSDVSINKRTDTLNLSNVYKGILHNYRSIQNIYS